MPISEQEKAVLNRMLQLIEERGSQFYEIGVQTTVLSRGAHGWRNLLTKFDFVRRGESRPDQLSYQYEEAAIIRRLLPHAEAAIVLEKLSSEGVLETGSPLGEVPFQWALSVGTPTRYFTSAWSGWPSDIFTIGLLSGVPRQGALVAASPPYFPTLEQVLWQFFGFRDPNYMDHFRGAVQVVLPDFRARISKLTIALGYLKVDIENIFLRPDELVAQVYADNAGRLLAQKTVDPVEPSLKVDLDDRPSFVSVALVDKPTGETLQIKSFQAGRGSLESDVIFETSLQEIEQMLLDGENEVLEFKERVQKETPSRLAKTAVAFANTEGGTIVIGVDDDGRVVGCEIEGLRDRVTSILRGQCDPAPLIETEVVQHQDKPLLLVKVSQSKDRLHIVRDVGPLIRANATNRVPTGDELARLCRRFAEGSNSLFSSPGS